MNEHEIIFAVVGTTLVMLMLVCFIIFLMLRCSKQFQRGVKWAEENSKYEFTRKDMEVAYNTTPLLPYDKWIAHFSE